MTTTTSLVWIVQRNLGSSDDVGRLATAFDVLDVPSRLVDAVPFSDDIPEVERDGPIVAYGSTRFIDNVSRSSDWRPGAFFDRDKFSMRAYIENYDVDALNASGAITTIKDFPKLGFDSQGRIFVRPQLDLKAFEAQVTDVRSLQLWFDKICREDFELQATTEILVARPVEIEAEWRTFMVDGRCCTGSLYRVHGELRTESSVPQDVAVFAERLASVWTPARVFVMDIGLTSNGYKVIELNCFNSSGFYESDVTAIVREVSDVALSEFDQYAEF